LIACENERFEALRPSGNSIFAAAVATPSASSTMNRMGWRSSRRPGSAATKLSVPSAITVAT
jgi:hypothetical protein